jgi:GNAT superfamily N-acetyltransferase
MDVSAPIELVDVGPDNVDETSFFCLQSRPDSAGSLRKRAWLEKRFSEGLRIRMLGRREKKRWTGDRGFIEYIPGEYAWRGVEAGDYLFIHCLWVVGKSQGHGGARALLEACFDDARDGGYAGVATVTAENGFATGRAFYEHFGFEAVAECDPNLSLMVHQLADQADPPVFSAGSLRGPVIYDSGLTIVVSDQCPYLDDATRLLETEGEALGLDPVSVVELASAEDVREKSPTPFGVFAAVLDGHLLSYRYLTRKELAKAVTAVRA